MTKPTQKLLLLTAILLSLTINTEGQKIFPGAVGYGTEERGAYAGNKEPTILIVDTLYAGILHTGTNRGSFQWAVMQSYPRIIVFEVGGLIDYAPTSIRSFTIENPYINIYGQTSPGPGITIRSVNISFRSHDLLMQHIAIRLGDYPKPDGTIEVGDCFTALPGSYNIVIDHCSMSWGTDETFSTYGSNFTLSNCLVYEGLNYSYHCNESGDNEPEVHGLGAIVVPSRCVSIYNSLMGWYTERFPRLKTDSIVYINNYATGYAYHGADIRSASTGNNAAFIGNSFYPTISRSHYLSEYFMYWRAGLNTSSKVFLQDNNCIRSDNGYPQDECIHSEISESDFDAIFTDNPDENVIDVSEYKIVDADDVMDSVLINSGHRPWDRDYYDSIAFIKLKANEQDYINSVRDQPAKAYNLSIYEGLKTTAGNMENGYDFSNSNVSFTVNGFPVNLVAKTSSQREVLNAINSQLPEHIEAIDHPNAMCNHIIIQTTLTGSDQEIEIGGNASVFGIANGTYTGEDAPYDYYEYESAKHVLEIPQNPHFDSDSDGYTNIEEWANAFPEEISFDPILIKVAYVTSNRIMDSTATLTANDTIIKLLKDDEYFDVTVFEVGENDTIDFSAFDIAVIQECLDPTSSFLAPTGFAGLSNIPIPFVYNNVYAFQDGGNLTFGGGSAGKAIGVSITVDPSNQLNELFNGIAFEGNKFKVFNATASDNGAEGDDALNYAKGVSISQTNTLLGTIDELTDESTSIFLNDIPEGTQVGSEVLAARMIVFGMNLGAISKDNGENITKDGITLWRNALYSLAELSVPESGVGGTNEEDLTIVNIDFGSDQTMAEPNWNNFTVEYNTPDSLMQLIDSEGNNTGIEAYVYDPFSGVNTGGGTTSPDVSLALQGNATSDSYYGHTKVFLERIVPTGGIIFKNLDEGRPYTLKIFASRTADDNREAKYSAIGKFTKEVFLNASNNTSEFAIISDIYPDSEGKIKLMAEPGPNNDNGLGFFYIGVIRLIYNSAIVHENLEGTINIDCGDEGNSSEPNWNNFTLAYNTPDSIVPLINAMGDSTGINAYVYDPFSGVNDNDGTDAPDETLGMPSTATMDSYFGHPEIFLDRIAPTGGFRFENLDVNKAYSFHIFGSRIATDNRETEYTVIGQNSSTALLNISSNSTEVATIENIYPDINGRITLNARPGPNNNNSLGFFYIGAIRITYDLEDTPTAISDFHEQIADVDNIHVFPVPFSNRLSLSNVPLQSTIAVYTISGVKVIEMKNEGSASMSVNTASLKNGIYILRVRDGRKLNKSYKVIKVSQFY